MDADKKAALFGLLDDATDAGWSFASARQQLEFGEVPAYRSRERRTTGEFDVRRPGGNLMYRLLNDEAHAIVELYRCWREIDRSHRNLAYRGSFTNTLWMAPSSLRRLFAAHRLLLHPPKRPGTSATKPFPEWVEYRPNQIWIYDTAHFTRPNAAVIIVEDFMSRKWIAHIVSSQKTSTQIEVVFTEALAAKGLLDAIERRQHGPVHIPTDYPGRRILRIVWDSGADITSGSTREFMARARLPSTSVGPRPIRPGPRASKGT